MKIKRLFILGLFLLFSGGVLTVFGLMFVDFNVRNFDTLTYTEFAVDDTQSLISGELKTIEIDVDEWKVNIKRGNEFKFSYVTTEKTKVEYGFSEGNGKFSFEANEGTIVTNFFNSFIGLKKKDYTYSFTIPQGVELTVTSNNSSLNIDGDFDVVNISANNGDGNFVGVAKNINFDLKNANFFASNATFEAVGALVKNGNLVFDKVSMTQMDAKLDNAGLSLDAIDVQSFVNIDASNSYVSFDESSIGLNLSATLSNTNVFIDELVVQQGIKVDARNSNFRADELTSSLLEVSASNADFNFDDSQITTIDYEGSNSSFRTEREFDSKDMTFKGSNLTLRVNIECSISDFKSINASISNGSLKVNDEKINLPYTSNSGERTLSVTCSNSSFRLYTIGYDGYEHS